MLDDIRSEIKAWFKRYSPTEADDWTRTPKDGSIVAEVLRYGLVVYTYTPALPLPDTTNSPTERGKGQQETDARRVEVAPHNDPTDPNQEADGKRPDEPAQDDRPAGTRGTEEAVQAGTWDDIHAVWTKDRDRTWVDLRPAGRAQEKYGSDDGGQPTQRHHAVPEWAFAAKTAATGPQPSVNLFRPRDRMSVRCEKTCFWCDEQCYQARNMRYAGHNGRCLCAKHTQMALAQTGKKYLCSSTEHHDDTSGEYRRTQPACQKWTDWSSIYWDPSYADGTSNSWYSSGWRNTQWRHGGNYEEKQEQKDDMGTTRTQDRQTHR